MISFLQSILPARVLVWLLLWWWQPEQRGLFLYWTGQRWTTVDSLAALRQFMGLAGFDWDTEHQAMLQPNAVVQLHTASRIAGAVRRVFYDEGLTETECLNLFWQFRDHVDGVKKNGSLWPTSQDSTESPSLVDPPLPPPLPSASGSTRTEPSIEPHGLPAAVTPS